MSWCLLTTARCRAGIPSLLLTPASAPQKFKYSRLGVRNSSGSRVSTHLIFLFFFFFNESVPQRLFISSLPVQSLEQPKNLNSLKISFQYWDCLQQFEIAQDLFFFLKKKNQSANVSWKFTKFIYGTFSYYGKEKCCSE